ncbi:MAG: glycosyltransferase family 4 protein, partial [Gammaproteobacteria bacterium]|nr:glycosyltransferase family 4 protein [Gammaproteobacteria bacterium]
MDPGPRQVNEIDGSEHPGAPGEPAIPTGPLLLVTRNYPPQVGGLERYAADLHHALAERLEVELLASRSGKRGIPWLVARVLWRVARAPRRYWRIHFADAALAPLAVLVRRIAKAPVTVSTHALDVVYANALYQWLVSRSLRRLDGVVSVSRYTRDACLERGVDPARCRVIPNGIRFDSSATDARAAGAPDGLPDGLEGRRVLVTVGRLVRRKGVGWFVAEVMPRLDPSWICLVGGAGPERARIADAVAAHGLESRVHLLGAVDERRKAALLDRADLFVMPNVPVPGDAEGFGISAIESTAHGVPVLASDLEGLRDAVVDGVTGRLVPPL